MSSIYNILAKLNAVIGMDAPKAEAKPLYESVEARGSITEAVKSLESKYATFKESKLDDLADKKKEKDANSTAFDTKAKPTSNKKEVKGTRYGNDKADLDEGKLDDLADAKAEKEANAKPWEKKADKKSDTTTVKGNKYGGSKQAADKEDLDESRDQPGLMGIYQQDWSEFENEFANLNSECQSEEDWNEVYDIFDNRLDTPLIGAIENGLGGEEGDAGHTRFMNGVIEALQNGERRYGTEPRAALTTASSFIRQAARRLRNSTRDRSTMVDEAKVLSKFTVVSSRRGKDRAVTRTIPELVDYFRYTLEVGKSYEHERGNAKINMNPKNIEALVRNLNNAKSNGAANGSPDTYYYVGDESQAEVEQPAIAEGKNHMGEREYQSYASWKAACKKAYPGCAFRGDKDIGAATMGSKDVGEWDGAVGSVFVKQTNEGKIDDLNDAKAEKEANAKPWEKKSTDKKSDTTKVAGNKYGGSKQADKDDLDEAYEFKSKDFKNSSKDLKKVTKTTVKESRNHQTSMYTYEEVANALATEQPGLDANSQKFVDAVYHELIALGMTPKSASHYVNYDEDFISDAATAYAHASKSKVNHAHESALEDITKLAGLAKPVPAGASTISPLAEEDSNEIDPQAWYVVTSQGVESGPYINRLEAKQHCPDLAHTAMYGEEVIDVFPNELDEGDFDPMHRGNEGGSIDFARDLDEPMQDDGSDMQFDTDIDQLLADRNIVIAWDDNQQAYYFFDANENTDNLEGSDGNLYNDSDEAKEAAAEFYGLETIGENEDWHGKETGYLNTSGETYFTFEEWKDAVDAKTGGAYTIDVDGDNYAAHKTNEDGNSTYSPDELVGVWFQPDSEGKVYEANPVDESWDDIDGYESNDPADPAYANKRTDLASTHEAPIKGSKFSMALEAARADSEKEFAVDGTQYTVKEGKIDDLNDAKAEKEANAKPWEKKSTDKEDDSKVVKGTQYGGSKQADDKDDVAESINLMRKLSGMPTVESAEKPRDIEYVNTPHEKTAPVSAAIPSGTDLNKSKRQDPKTANKAANPATVQKVEETKTADALWNKYAGMLTSLLK